MSISIFSKAVSILVHIFIAILIMLSILPFILILSSSFTAEGSISEFGYSLIPRKFSLDAYRYIFLQAGNLINSYFTTIIVTVIGTSISILFTTMFAYPLSRRSFILRNKLSFFVFFTMLFNGGIIPTYILVSRYLHLKDTLMALILPYIITPFNVLLIRNFFISIPESIIESAKIDGASEYRIFFRIIVPVSLPGIATIGLFTTLTYWNDWFQALLYIDSAKMMPMQFLLQRIMSTVEFITSSNNPQLRSMELPRESARMAMSILAVGPIVFAYPFFQKYFIKGLTIGAVKG